MSATTWWAVVDATDGKKKEAASVVMKCIVACCSRIKTTEGERTSIRARCSTLLYQYMYAHLVKIKYYRIVGLAGWDV